MSGLRVNVGCGASPTPGWVNLDNSWTVRLARRPLALSLLQRARLVSAEQRAFAQVARERGIAFAEARKLPLADASVEVLYTSHMLEHLSRDEARAFLGEVRRVLQPGGVARVAVPDLALIVRRYRDQGDADRLVESTLLAPEPARGLRGALRSLVVGPRHHAWMYDGPSLVRLLNGEGFFGARIMPAGTTTIPEPGELNLREREEESVYVEARKP